MIDKNIIAQYLLKKGKELMDQARLTKLDTYAVLFHQLLEELGATDEAQELYEYYERTA
jgi:hypothetical protein